MNKFNEMHTHLMFYLVPIVLIGLVKYAYISDVIFPIYYIYFLISSLFTIFI